MCALNFFRTRVIAGFKCRSFLVFQRSLTVSRISHQWEISSAVCIERKPVITQELCEIEKKHLELMEKIEIEKSFLSEHEIHYRQDLERSEKLKKGEIDITSASMKMTAQDFEDQCTKEFLSFSPAPRVTDADVHENRKSVSRKLDQTLFLILKQKFGDEFHWTFPQATNNGGETLRQTAERAIDEMCGHHLKVQILGNAPVGYYKYKYPKTLSEQGVLGCKVFFYRANYVIRNLFQDDAIANDFLWLSLNELRDVLHGRYYRTVNTFLIPSLDYS